MLSGSSSLAALVDIRQVHRWTEVDGPLVGWFLAGDEPEQRGLAGSVWADDPDDGGGWHVEVQLIDEKTVSVALGDARQSDHLVAEALGEGDDELESVGSGLHVSRLGDEPLVGGEARLALRLPGPWRHPNPLQLALYRAAPRLRLALVLGEPRLLLFEPARVVALEWVGTALVEFEDPAGDLVEEIAVVGDGDDSPGIFLEMALQPCDRLGVEVVGRLVEQQKIGCGKQKAAKRNPAALTPRQGGYRGIPRRHPKGVHGDLDLAFQVPGAGRLDPTLQLGLLGAEGVVVGVGIGPTRQYLLVAVEERLDRRHPVHHIPDDILVGVEHRFLRQQTHGEPFPEPGIAGCGLVLARHHPQEGGFPRPIGADHPDLGAVVEAEGDLAQHVSVRWDMTCGAHHRVNEVGHGGRR